ncbi:MULTISPECIES: FABP family protein [unclassified Rhodococcus (in: high G+C Gram-positive bacteria)]|uniref:FABP family protein n=1 Tax=unclassified Rhodococcus (in: high G+C Gram-positive bacteria) TaxID=192944 RepID=UPI0006F83679|nr:MULTISPECIES: FABP family protein [unclassified Rhodococcus (in: high G+C Gram-positive bacteria)]KQU39226.1 fatty acid-binding protein [Rhodococcus sp. Leaf225]KQU43662.1 fatty acid-binding protein [Rhodococcus sp. Leaf258]
MTDEFGTPAPRLSGDAAVARAEERAKETAGRNIPLLPDLPGDGDTANLRQGPDISHSMLALLPLVGVWRGTGEGHDAVGDYTLGQQIVVSHDGGPYLSWESRTWRVDENGAYAGRDLRESGFWRVSGTGEPGDDGEETLELLLTHASGLIELYYGRALTQSSWELATDVVIRSTSAALVGGAKRLYGIVEGGDLAYVEERVGPDGDLEPRLSARLERYVG